MTQTVKPMRQAGGRSHFDNPQELTGTLLHDDWDKMKQSDIDRAAGAETKMTRGDLPYHYWIPRVASYFLADEFVRHLTEEWEAFETRAAMQVDATDIFEGYAGIRDEPSLGNVWPEMYATLEQFYATYPELLGAGIHGEAVGRVLDRIRARTKAPKEAPSAFPVFTKAFRALARYWGKAI